MDSIILDIVLDIQEDGSITVDFEDIRKTSSSLINAEEYNRPEVLKKITKIFEEEEQRIKKEEEEAYEQL